MKKIAMILLVLPTLAFADVPTKDLTPIVKFHEDQIQLKDKFGNRYLVTTDCSVDADQITEFTVRSRKVKEGTPIKFSKKKTCSVEKVTMM